MGGADPAPRRRLLVTLAGAATLPACSASYAPAGTTAGVGPRGSAILLRGLANVFSTGMDTLARELAQAGFQAEVHNHTAWTELARDVPDRRQRGDWPRPLAVGGHSLGADDAIRLAGALGEAGVPVDILVTFDPVWVASVPPGPRRVLNFWRDGGLWGRSLAPGQGFAGAIENVGLDAMPGVNHFTIDKDPRLHARVVALLQRAVTETA